MQKIKFSLNKLKISVLLLLGLLLLLSFVSFARLSNLPKPAHADTCPYHGTPLTAAMGGTALTTGDYYLTGDITVNDTIYIAAGANVNVCLNGYMLTFNTAIGFRCESSTGTLNIYDCGNTVEQKHYYTKDTTTGKYVFGSGTDYISGGVICTANTGGRILLIQAGTLNINGGTFSGGHVIIQNGSGTVNVYGGTFSKAIPATIEGDSVVNHPLEVDGKTYGVTLVSMGNPHCVVFEDPDNVDLERIGKKFENHSVFPDRVNTEFVKVTGKNKLKMRVWERGSGETFACGTGACAAAVASVLNGFCDMGAEITVQLLGGELKIVYTPETVFMTGGATLVFTGEVEI